MREQFNTSVSRGKQRLQSTCMYRSFATRVSWLKIWHFWVIGSERNVCRCTFN